MHSFAAPNLSTILRSLCAAGALLAIQALHAGADIRVPADYPTIQEAIDAAFDNAVIEVDPGIYQESLVVFGKTIEIRSLVENQALVSAPSGTTLLVTNGGFVTLRDFFMSGAPAVRASDGGGVSVIGGRLSDTSPLVTVGGVAEAIGLDASLSINDVNILPGLRTAAVYAAACRDVSVANCTIPPVGTSYVPGTDAEPLLVDGAESVFVQDCSFTGNESGAGARILQAGTVSLTGTVLAGGDAVARAPKFLGEDGGPGLACADAISLTLFGCTILGGDGASQPGSSLAAGNGAVGLRITGTTNAQGTRCEIRGGRGGDTLANTGGAGGNGLVLQNATARLDCSWTYGGAGGSGRFFFGASGEDLSLQNSTLLGEPCRDTFLVK